MFQPSTLDRVTVTITRSGREKWLIQVASIHGHSRKQVASYHVKFEAPPRALLDPEVCTTAGRGAMHALEELEPLLFASELEDE